jgi:hypothetical protein
MQHITIQPPAFDGTLNGKTGESRSQRTFRDEYGFHWHELTPGRFVIEGHQTAGTPEQEQLLGAVSADQLPYGQFI